MIAGLRKVLKRLRSDKRGFTLVEVLVAITIFAVAIVPIMSTFVTVTKMNTKGRRKSYAQIVGQNVIEGVKGFGVKEFYDQCKAGKSGSDFTIVTNTVGASEVTTENSTFHIYKFKLSNVEQGALKFNVEVDLLSPVSSQLVTDAEAYTTFFNQANLAMFKKHKITVRVYLVGPTGQDPNKLVEYSTYFADNSSIS